MKLDETFQKKSERRGAQGGEGGCAKFDAGWASQWGLAKEQTDGRRGFSWMLYIPLD